MKKIIIFLLILFLLISCESLTEPKEKDIKYEITGTAEKVDITIENSEGGTSQYSDKGLPWTYTFSAPKGTWVYCSAQNCGRSGSVQVTIYINGKYFKSSYSQGAYVIATASGDI